MRILPQICMLFPAFFFTPSCAYQEPELYYKVSTERSSNARIRKPESCNSDISNGGGDYVEGNLQLRGKCDGGGISPSISTDMDGNNFILFQTDPTYAKGGRSRTELALTRDWFKFGEPIYMGFKIKIPEDSSVTNDFFYLMQWWQCAPNSPIAGIRLDRGTSHSINFMTRGDEHSASMAKYTLVPEKWKSFVIKGIVDPTGSSSQFVVWDSPDSVSKTSLGAYGYEKKMCKGGTKPPQRFRLKFGIYKGTEANKKYLVGWDEIRIGSTFNSVSPWKQH